MRQHSARQRDRTDHILKIHDPAPAPALIEERIGDVLDELGTAIISRSREPVRDRARRAIARPRALLVLAAGVALTGGATAAATNLFVPTHTGVHASRADARVGGPGELLNTAGTDFRRVALELASDIPYPTGYVAWRNWVISQQAPSGSPCPPGSGRRGCAILDSTGALHGWFAMSAFCAWVIDWRQATLAGDRARAGRDARTIMPRRAGRQSQPRIRIRALRQEAAGGACLGGCSRTLPRSVPETSLASTSCSRATSTAGSS